MLSKTSQSQKDKYCDSTYLRYLAFKSIETESRVVSGAGGRANGKILFNGYRVSVLQEEAF